MERPNIEHASDLENYSPPRHVGTQNVRLVEPDFCGHFEMIRGIVQPGGEAETHFHESAYQAIYVISGSTDVTLGEDAPVRCEAGAIIRIPPRMPHRVVCLGPEPLEVVIVYSPPLPRQGAFRGVGGE